ncbi:MAG: O-antigen ligase family protein [Pyrinomonadaceae bacterium]
MANFLPSISQPASIIGYLWKVEFAFAGLLFLTLFFALKFPKNKINFIRFADREVLWIVLPLILFTIWSGLSIIWAESWRNALHHTLLWACYGLFYFLARQIIAKPRLLDFSLKFTGLIMLILGITCLIEYLSNAQAINSFFTYRYYKYAEALVTLLPMYLALTLQLKSRFSLFAGVIAFTAWLVMLLSLSRTVFIAGFVCVGLFFALVFLFYGWKTYIRKSFLMISLFLVAMLITQTLSSATKESSTIKRFTSNEDSQANLEWRYMVWGMTFEAFKQTPFKGMGADNFVVDYRTIRENYSTLDLENKLLETDGIILPERTHNEYLQILSELGLVGAIFFGWFLFGIAWLFISIRKKSVSLLSIASFAGMCAFLISSLASSYSFRVPANGVCFFFMLALATQGLRKEKEATKERQFNFDFIKLKPVFVGFGMTICVLMLIFSAVRGVSLMYLQFALSSSEESEAKQNYQKAIAFDNQDGLFRYYYGLQLYNWKSPEEAIPQMRFAIDKGIATSISYFNLASAQIVARQTNEAEQTFIESLRVYPRSVFLRTAYASFLKENDKELQAQNEYEKVLQINPAQAKSWWIAHNAGMEKLTRTENQDNNFVKVMDLKPTDGIYALVDFQRKNNPKLVGESSQLFDF